MSRAEERLRKLLAEIEASTLLGESEHLLRMIQLILTTVFRDD